MVKKNASEKAEVTPTVEEQTIGELMVAVSRLEGMVTRLLTLNLELERKVDAVTQPQASGDGKYKDLEDRVDTFEAQVQFIRDETLPRIKKIEDALKRRQILH